MKKLLIITILLLMTLSVQGQDVKKIYNTVDFSIQFPLNWKLVTQINPQAVFVITSPITSDDNKFAENVNLITQNLKGMDMDLETYINLNKEAIVTIPNAEIFESKKEKREGKEYHILIFKGNMDNMDLKVRQLYAIKNEVAYVLTFTVLEKEFTKHEKIGAEILDSFKLKN
jgi:hypothetical protein